MHRAERALTLRVEYAERGKEYGILFMFSLFRECPSIDKYPCHIQGQPGGIHYSYSCRCATGIREYLFNTLGADPVPGPLIGGEHKPFE